MMAGTAQVRLCPPYFFRTTMTQVVDTIGYDRIESLASIHTFAPKRERFIPKGGEQRAFTALAQAIGALAAHPGSGGGLADAAGAGERVEKPQLALGGPAVSSTSLRAGAADSGAGFGRTKRIGCAHPAVWITTGGV